ncbi:MAG TPA: homocysteine S-methyltransferase family protein [Lacipirellulaceae bacterium]|nr:homocysteine S-methyltransferase family protein [Lacipirellulaceae bacterium]
MHRTNLPQLSGARLLTDGGIETDLLFHHGIELPHMATYVLLETDAGRAQLHQYFAGYLALADEYRAGLLLDSATWRANPDWAERIGTPRARLADVNRQAIDFLQMQRQRRSYRAAPTVISGAMGPRGDAYRPDSLMQVDEAAEYHAPQIEAFHRSGADLATAYTLTNIPEAAGIARAAAAIGMPVAISFTLETDGRLPTGPTLREAVEQVDALTQTAPAYYMINCAHPTHFQGALESGQPWAQRIRGVRANSSRKSHAELDESPALDEGNPQELGGEIRDLVADHPQLCVLGGCCGTDLRHIREIAAACLGGQGERPS